MNSTTNLKSAITTIKGFGPKKAEAFERLGIFCVEDFLRFYPRDYEDLRNRKLIANLKNEEKAVVEGTVVINTLGRGYGRKRTLHLAVVDKTGRMNVLFFMAGFMAKNFKIGETYRFFGKVKVENGSVTMFHPAYSLVEEDSGEAGIIPVYPLTKGLTQKDLRKGIKAALECVDEYPESLPQSIIDKANLCPIDYAFKQVHFPEDANKFSAARFRLIFEELFDLRVALRQSANRFGQGRKGISFKAGSYDSFINSLSYELTAAQKRALSEINDDMNSPRAMNRLLQGDVGSGKTLVAEAAMFKAVKAGYQAAFMAPTEILASQHYQTLQELGLNIDLLTSSVSASEKRAILDRLKSGETDIVVGTHAIISNSVQFANLGLVITDEQHRFGVVQRKKLSEKANNPDILVMTATPIPRTLAVVIYSDMDISIIDELPPGRKEIETVQFNEASRSKAYSLLIEEVNKGRQAYIVAPFIEDSESIMGNSAESLYDDFKHNNLNISCALLHGDLKQSEKDDVMSRFASGEISVLISTVVIEVGINVPNASVMLIENSERFGLAQMHQLRGRVGRGEYQSYCFIILGEETEIAKQRADIMCNSSDGFYIAEKDLEIRGPGELFGYRQHGLPQLQLADPGKHMKIVEIASKLADEILLDDPKLAKPENEMLKNAINKSYGNEISLVL